MWFLLGQMALQAFTSFQAGQIASGEAKLNQKIAERNALLADIDVRRREVLQQEAGIEGAFAKAQVIGSAKVRAGASGAATGVGAPVGEIAMISAWADLKNMQRVRAIQEGIEDAKQAVASARVQAVGFGGQAKTARSLGNVGAATAILGGLTKGTQLGFFNQPKRKKTSHDPAVAARLDAESFGRFPTSFG